MKSSNWLAAVFEWLGETFEKFNPAAFRFLAAVLPYLTPFPVAWITMTSATEFLGFTPGVAFTFVFALEGLGLWFTSLFVESVIGWIRTKNKKTIFLVFLFGVIVAAYIYLLVSLNVILKGDNNRVMRDVITILCFLPLLSGIGNGYYKWSLEVKREEKELNLRREAREDDIRREQQELKLKKAMIKHGMNPLHSYQFTIPPNNAVLGQFTSVRHDDWRKLTQKEKQEISKMSVQEIMAKYGIGESTAFRWKHWAKIGK